MARRPRLHLPSVPQHVVQRGNNREACFRDDVEYRLYLKWLEDGAIRCGCLIHSYVLMTNHVHLLLTGDTENSIPELMQSLGRRFVRYVNERHGRSGTLWEGRYHASLVDSENHLLRCMRYIEANPVRAAMVGSPAAWRWSSFRCNALGVPDDRVTPHSVYQRLGVDPTTRRAAYVRLFDEILAGSDLDCIRAAARSGLPIGSEKFRQWVARRLGPAAVPGMRGRPTAHRTNA